MNGQTVLRQVFSRRMLVSGLMGFSCGLPLLLTITVLQAWMKEEGVDLTSIGLMSLVGLPYSLKFLWSPLLDRYVPPFLGRRRGWLLMAQILLAGSIVVLGLTRPSESLWMVVWVAFLVTFFSATQDIVVDAYRREDLADAELGLGSSLYVNGYRLGMLLASGGGLILADHMSFGSVYLIMAGFMSIGLATTLLTPEPKTPQGAPQSLQEAVIEPFVEYFQRPGAVLILAFILLYKIGDTVASSMTIPFYLELGFTKTQIGAVVKLFGFWATVGGGLAGGLVMLRLSIFRSLWFFGILQAVSTAGFAALAYIGPNVPALTAVITFENFSSGLGTAACVAFMAALVNKRFTATQYALLSSLIGVPRVMASAPTGLLATMAGWPAFFIVCTIIAIPGLMLLMKLSRENPQNN